jgi:EamA domain-containing membrane protein RarD
MAKANDFMLKADRKLLAERFEKRRQAWEKKRRHGMVLYVFVRWVLLLGGFLCLTPFFVHYLDPKPYRDILTSKFAWIFVAELAIAALVGVWDWFSNEKRYRRT